MPPSPAYWRIVGTSVTGTRHLTSNTDCEDTLGYRSLSNGTILLAVADGAGSASRAKEGAQCAVQTALAFAETMLAQSSTEQDEDFCRDVLEQTLQAVHDSIEQLALNQTALHEFATTFLFAMITPERLAVLQVGDGAIVIQQEDETLQTITVPGYAEYINECSFVTDADYRAHAQYSILPLKHTRGIAMLTDGLQALAIELATNIAYAPFFIPLFEFAAREDRAEVELTQELHDFLASKRVCQYTDDDKTLVLAVPL
jgi:Protein phosphatase 2C